MPAHNFEKGEMPDCIKLSYEANKSDKTNGTKNLDNNTTVKAKPQIQNQKRKRTDSADPSTEPEAKKAKIKATKQELDARKLCSLIIGGRKYEFEAKEVSQSYTLQALLRPDDDLDSDEDIQRIAKCKNGRNSAVMSPERFTEACGHTAWLFLRNGKTPNLKTFDPAGKHDVGQEIKDAYDLFPDRGELVAAAQLYDMGLALRSPNLQRVAIKWYEEIRVATWGPNTPAGRQTRKVWADPRTQKKPEYKRWTSQYASWLQLLKRYDPAIQSAISEAADAGNNGLPGLATDIPQLSQLEPAYLYDRYMSDEEPLEVSKDDGVAQNTTNAEELHVSPEMTPEQEQKKLEEELEQELERLQKE